MKTTETSMKIFKIESGANRVKDKIHNSLSLAIQGKAEQATELFTQAAIELEVLKEEHSRLRNSCKSSDYKIKEQDNSIGLMEILKENIYHAGLSSSRCGGVQFHVYS